MHLSIILSSLLSFAMGALDSSSDHSLQKREDEDGSFSCYDLTNIWGFSALCPNINFPITNDRGLSMMGTLYFALASTTVPDDTVYNAQENIICTVNGRTGNITATIGANAGGDIVQAGASVTFSMSLPNFDGTSLCMFTEGTDDDDKNVTTPITLAQARGLLYDMLTAPDVDCKTCGRIPIGYPAVKNGTAPTGSGVLKIDVTSANNCIGKCVGPNSFSTASSSPTPSSSSPAVKVGVPFMEHFGVGHVYAVATAWLLGIAVLNFKFV